MNEFWISLTTIGGALVTVAIISVLVSKNANTSGVISAATSGFAKDLAVAVSPVTGGGSYGSGNLATFNLDNSFNFGN